MEDSITLREPKPIGWRTTTPLSLVSRQRADWNALRGGAHHRVSLCIRVLAYIVHLYGGQPAKPLGWPLPKTKVGYNCYKNSYMPKVKASPCGLAFLYLIDSKLGAEEGT